MLTITSVIVIIQVWESKKYYYFFPHKRLINPYAVYIVNQLGHTYILPSVNGVTFKISHSKELSEKHY